MQQEGRKTTSKYRPTECLLIRNIALPGEQFFVTVLCFKHQVVKILLLICESNCSRIQRYIYEILQLSAAISFRHRPRYKHKCVNANTVGLSKFAVSNL